MRRLFQYRQVNVACQWVLVCMLGLCSIGDVVAETFHSKLVGWTYPIPQGWPVMEKKEFQRLEQKGKHEIEATMGGKFQLRTVNLLSLKINPFNVFSAIAEPYDGPRARYGEYQANIFNVMLQTYKRGGIKHKFSRYREKLDGLEFEVLQVEIMDKQGKLLLHQLVYDRLIGKYGVLFSVNYNKEVHKKALLKALRHSKFSIRK